MYLYAACCMTISAKHLVRYSRNEMLEAQVVGYYMALSLVNVLIGDVNLIQLAHVGSQRQIFALIVIDHIRPSAYIVCITGLNIKEFYVPPVDCNMFSVWGLRKKQQLFPRTFLAFC